MLLGFLEKIRLASGIEQIPPTLLWFVAFTELAFAYFCLCFHTFFHEFGHYLACRLVGTKPRVVKICAKEYRFRRLGETRFLFGLLPLPSGFVGDPERPRLLQPTPVKQVIVSLGGIGATALLSALSLAFAAHSCGLVRWHAGLFGALGVSCVIANSAGDNTDGERFFFAIRRFRSGSWPEELPETARQKYAFAVSQAGAVLAFFLTLFLFVI
ncbi:site-2 protease family protein [Desulfovirgula thermocuniculi]|uniref:site-2 protease family protein n=1 Tax=Desulfovirgula thermocuniculi TaxID=348842 RepID=UPI003CCC314E